MSNPIMAKIKSRVAKAGTWLCVSEGEDSNYSILGLYVVLKDFTPYNELDFFLAEHPDQRETYKFNSAAFLAYLINNGFFLEIKYGLMYMGSSSSIENFLFLPSAGES